MAKEFDTIEREESHLKQKQQSREEIDAALARLQAIAEKLPPVDVVAIIREGRDLVSNRNR